MKKQRLSIMNMTRKKIGLAALCGVMSLVLGTGFTFEAEGAVKEQTEIIKEDIMIATAYKFAPNPDIYGRYSTYGITLSDDGEALLYNGQKVRLFTDEGSDEEVFFVDDEGTVDLAVVRNGAGDVDGIERISHAKAMEYRSAFFAGDSGAAETALDPAGRNKFAQYAAWGITASENGQVLYYGGQRVKLLADQYSDSVFETFWVDEAGTARLSVIRGVEGQITAIEEISEEREKELLEAAGEMEKRALNGLVEKVEKRIGGLYLGR